MNEEESKKDLIVLAADKDARLAIDSLLRRHAALSIRSISFTVEQHEDHDGGCRTKGVAYLRQAESLFRHALLVFDYEGCGEEGKSADAIAADLDGQLAASGWGNRARTIIIEPELENWIWSASSHVPRELGWQQGYDELKNLLTEQCLWMDGSIKPYRPKEAMRYVLRKNRKTPSSAIHKAIAGKVSLGNCQDRSFCLLKSILSGWFG